MFNIQQLSYLSLYFDKKVGDLFLEELKYVLWFTSNILFLDPMVLNYLWFFFWSAWSSEVVIPTGFSGTASVLKVISGCPCLFLAWPGKPNLGKAYEI